MQTLIQAVRQIIGEPNFFMDGSQYNSWDYGSMCEYFICALILLIVISSVFKFILNLSK